MLNLQMLIAFFVVMTTTAFEEGSAFCYCDGCSNIEVLWPGFGIFTCPEYTRLTFADNSKKVSLMRGMRRMDCDNKVTIMDGKELSKVECTAFAPDYQEPHACFNSKAFSRYEKPETVTPLPLGQADFGCSEGMFIQYSDGTHDRFDGIVSHVRINCAKSGHIWHKNKAVDSLKCYILM